MNILVVAATSMEIQPFLEWKNNSPYKDSGDTLISGPGIFFTTLKLMESLHQNSFDFILQAGIAGAYPDSIPLGQVFQVEEEGFGDFGAMDREEFLDVFSLGLWDPQRFPFQGGKLINPYTHPNLTRARGLTLNCASGNEKDIKRIRAQFNPDLESLEGAPIAYIALSRGIPFLQIRSVSNRVEPRNRKSWDIPLAIKNLNQTLIEVFSTLMNHKS
jgi:futalosine hydrolase